GAGRLHVIDAVSAGYHALERRGDESTHEAGIRSDVYRRHTNDRDVAAWVLANGERSNRLKSRDQNHQIDHDRENGAFHEQIGKFHILSGGLAPPRTPFAVACGASMTRAVSAGAPWRAWPLFLNGPRLAATGCCPAEPRCSPEQPHRYAA